MPSITARQQEMATREKRRELLGQLGPGVHLKYQRDQATATRIPGRDGTSRGMKTLARSFHSSLVTKSCPV